MQVNIPGQLYDYTRGRSRVDASGANLGEVLGDLDRQFPGIRFRIVDEQDRIRRHIRIFVNHDQAPDLRTRVGAKDRIMIFGALSGG
jgi:sulfur-carrier protein